MSLGANAVGGDVITSYFYAALLCPFDVRYLDSDLAIGNLT